MGRGVWEHGRRFWGERGLGEVLAQILDSSRGLGMAAGDGDARKGQILARWNR